MNRSEKLGINLRFIRKIFNWEAVVRERPESDSLTATLGLEQLIDSENAS